MLILRCHRAKSPFSKNPVTNSPRTCVVALSSIRAPLDGRASTCLGKNFSFLTITPLSARHFRTGSEKQNGNLRRFYCGSLTTPAYCPSPHDTQRRLPQRVTNMTRHLILFAIRIAVVSCLGCGIAAAGHIPAPIATRSAETIATWVEISRLVDENEALATPLPHPYVARGDLWASVDCHEDALADYLRATDLVLATKPSPAEKSRLLSRLHHSLRELVNKPMPAYSLESQELYRQGVTLFTQRQFEAALPYLEDAVRLSPSNSEYRAYLAVTSRVTGDQISAARHAASAANLLRSKLDSVGKRKRTVFNEAVRHIQGPQRVWLQTFVDSRDVSQLLETQARIGDAMNRLTH